LADETDNTATTLRTVVLFDACAPKMAKCISGRCENDPAILCKHRFNFDFYVVNGLMGQSYLQYVQLFDFQVILHFLHLIIQNGVPRPGNSKYVIVTKDKKFLKSAEGEWRTKARRQTKPKLTFGPDFVRNGKAVVYVECIESQSCGSDRYDDRAEVIRRLNEKFGQPAS